MCNCLYSYKKRNNFKPVKYKREELGTAIICYVHLNVFCSVWFLRWNRDNVGRPSEHWAKWSHKTTGIFMNSFHFHAPILYFFINPTVMAFFQPAGSASRLQGATVSFHNIHYNVKERGACLWAKRTLTKSILIDLKWVLPFQKFPITAIYLNGFWTCTFLLAIKDQKGLLCNYHLCNFDHYKF